MLVLMINIVIVSIISLMDWLCAKLSQTGHVAAGALMANGLSHLFNLNIYTKAVLTNKEVIDYKND